MTGTSCDGLDAACMEISPKGHQTLWTASAPYLPDLRKAVLSFQEPGTLQPIHRWLDLHRDLGTWYGRVIQKMLRRYSQLPDIIANHGQTIAHFPRSGRQGTTLQLGDASRIAQATGLTVICQFREGDLAAGGKGSPLVPRFHRTLVDNLGEPGDPRKTGIAIHNIGGISNMTYFGPKDVILAFDTGPGNIWIDAAVQKVTRNRLAFDKGGKLAFQGIAHAPSVKALLQHPFFSKRIPKSTGRDEFSNQYFFSRAQASGNSLVATATQVTVDSIAHSYQNWIIKKELPLRRVLICGGGAKNRALVRGLQVKLPGIEIASIEKYGFNPQYIEAQAFALLGSLALRGHPLGGAWTGARGFGPPGHIIPGENWNRVWSAGAGSASI